MGKLIERNTNMAAKIPPEQTSEFLEVFAMLSEQEGKEGCISTENLKLVMRNLGEETSDPELDEIIRESNGGVCDGDVTEDIYLSVIACFLGLDDPFESRVAFKCLDNDASGFVLVEDLKEVLRNEVDVLTAEKMDSIFVELDQFESGKVSYSEFKKVFCF